jgi:hypothetical protein
MDTAGSEHDRASWPPVVNTHVHLAPNFSAFETPEDAVRAARADAVRVMGASNFHDIRVYTRFGAAAEAAGILPLYGLEFITVADDLRDAGVKVNDPGNPGRMYLCGKGVDPTRGASAEVADITAAARAANEDRARELAQRLRDHFASVGIATSLDGGTIRDEVAERSAVPAEWVVLQERHIAMAFQEALFLQVPPDRRPGLLARAYGRSAAAPVEDPVAVQGEIRSRLMKAGGPAFVAETALSFDDAVRVILDADGIPAYPTLADGANPICPFETPAAELATRIKARGIHLAELIPVRNDAAVVDEYVAAFRAAGIAVMAGTEHNTLDRIPFDPACRGGVPVSAAAREAFWEGTCVVVAHQERRRRGLPGFVDRDGVPTLGFDDDADRIRWFADLGARIVAGEVVTA